MTVHITNSTLPRAPAACLGEHNEQVCKEILGLSDEEIADLMVEQVLY